MNLYAGHVSAPASTAAVLDFTKGPASLTVDFDRCSEHDELV
jgi:hypothetical protein